MEDAKKEVEAITKRRVATIKYSEEARMFEGKLVGGTAFQFDPIIRDSNQSLF
jgi:hypothetical protein